VKDRDIKRGVRDESKVAFRREGKMKSEGRERWSLRILRLVGLVNVWWKYENKKVDLSDIKKVKGTRRDWSWDGEIT